MSKIKCFKCKGKGRVVSDDAKFVTLLTLGLLSPLLFDKDECDACDGKGWIYDE